MSNCSLVSIGLIELQCKNIISAFFQNLDYIIIMQRNPIFRNEFKTRWSFSPIKRFSILGQKKVSGFSSPRMSPQIRASNLLICIFIYLFIYLFYEKLLDRLEFCHAVF